VAGRAIPYLPTGRDLRPARHQLDAGDRRLHSGIPAHLSQSRDPAGRRDTTRSCRVDLYSRIPLSSAIGPFAEFLSDTNPQPGSTLGTAFAAAIAGRNFCAFQTVSPLGDRVDEAVLLGRGYGCRYFELYAEGREGAGRRPAGALTPSANSLGVGT
jgi:hypothetical protein